MDNKMPHCDEHDMRCRDIIDQCRKIESANESIREIRRDLDSLNEIKTHLVYIRERIGTMVSTERYKPVEMLVYGFAGLVFIGIIGALVKLVMK